MKMRKRYTLAWWEKRDDGPWEERSVPYSKWAWSAVSDNAIEKVVRKSLKKDVVVMSKTP